MNKRHLKNALYEQVALLGSALSNPKRLELLDLLAQSEKTVEALAAEIDADVKLISAHLKALKAAHLVSARRDGKYMVYRLTGTDVSMLWALLREVAQAHVLELQQALQHLLHDASALAPLSRAELMAQAQRGDVVVIDVRPSAEYLAAHLPFARSMPVAELAQRLDELPKDKTIVAYCRGPFCLMADEALALLKAHGLQAQKCPDGVSEWLAAGLPLASLIAATSAVL